jgi:simple sugar transport system permease protein
MTSRIGSIDPNQVGLNYEMDAILAVALGGNSLAGGKYKISGSVIGAVTIQTLTTTLYALRVTADQLPVYKAIVVILIVAMQSQEFHRYRRRLMDRLTKKKAVSE